MRINIYNVIQLLLENEKIPFYFNAYISNSPFSYFWLLQRKTNYKSRCPKMGFCNKSVVGGESSLLKLAYLLIFLKEYRNLFYLRVGRWRYLLGYLRPLSSLYICVKSENFGSGTFIQHGFSTIITAERIGRNCWINQQVTIGYNNSRTLGLGQPTIGDNVRISAGAKVIGPITVGDNSIIGANAVVAKNLPENSIAIPSPTVIKEMKV